MHPKKQSVPIVKAFSDWIFLIAEAASSVVSPIYPVKQASVNTHVDAEPPSKLDAKCSVCQSSDHKVAMCEKFKNMALEKKLQVVKSNQLCCT